MSLGHISKFKIVRETNLGYVLELDGIEYFLHHNECNGKLLFPGDYVKAFLYMDKKNRIAATLFTPVLEADEIGFLKVVGSKEEIGVFCNIGISKDILFSRDDLPRSFKDWPKVDETILGELRVKNDHLVIKPATKTQILNKQASLSDVIKHEKGELVKAKVYRFSEDGISLVTEDFQVIFVYKTNYRKSYHLGEEVEVKILDCHDDYYNGTVNRNKEFQIQDDAKIILDYLAKNNGVSLITEKSSPELISKVLNMSKAAYKKALGGLLKENKIIITETKIILNDIEF